ncbi:MAG: dynamin family protein [Cyanobacteria bacterium J06635_1]
MSSQIIDRQLQAYRDQLDALLSKVYQLAANISDANLQETTDNLRKNINEPFLFVIVGEVKAGKSSFINALLGAEVCATDVEPCTDMVQQIVYADAPFEQQVEPSLKKIGRPIEILKEISIVDTPGTNTIIQNHQIITERYIPNSDLTFFVLFAKNPYQKSAWDFLGYVSDQWRKKVIFILQQADLLRKAEDLETNITRVQELANQHQIASPVIFATSAELEQEGDFNHSGFPVVRQYIKDIVATGETYRIKLRSVSETTRILITDLTEHVEALEQRLKTDQLAVTRIKRRFKTGQSRSQLEVDGLVRQLLDRYDTITTRIKREFRERLSFLNVVGRSFRGMFGRESSLKQWINAFVERCQEELRVELQDFANDGTLHLVDGIRQFGEDLTLELEGIPTGQVKSGRIPVKILERRQEVIEGIKAKVENLLEDDGLIKTLNPGFEGEAAGIGGAFAAVAVAIIQVIELLTAQLILSTLEVAFAGIGVLVFAVGFTWRRNRIIQEFERSLDSAKVTFAQDATDRLNQKLGLIYTDLERECSQFYADVDQEEREIKPILEKFAIIQSESKQVFNQLQPSLKQSVE